MSELVTNFKAADGDAVRVSIQDIKHHKSGKMIPYFSVSNGVSVTGFFVSDESMEKMYSVLFEHNKLRNRKDKKNDPVK